MRRMMTMANGPKHFLDISAVPSRDLHDIIDAFADERPGKR